MAGEARLRVRLISLALLGALGVGCASGPLSRSDPRDEEIRRLRDRVAELEREARVREVELRRLRTDRRAGDTAPAPQRAEPVARVRPTEEPIVADVAPSPEPRIQEDDLPVEPVAPAPDRPGDGPTPTPATPESGRSAASPASREAQTLYDEAYSLYHQGSYEEAESRFARYLELYPDTRLADNAQFWIGECRYAAGDHERALEAFLRTVERFPEGNKVPDAMVKAGKCLESLGDIDGARETYREVRRSHPGTAAAAIAEERLLMLR